VKKIIIMVCAASLALALTPGTATAASPQAHFYWSTPATCDVLGEIVLESGNIGTWGPGKVQGTSITLIRRWYSFQVTHVDTDEVLFHDRWEKRPDDIDDVCRFAWTQEIGEDDPYFAPGTYLFEGATGVKLTGRHS
jgi:hypothetical protein